MKVNKMQLRLIMLKWLMKESALKRSWRPTTGSPTVHKVPLTVSSAVLCMQTTHHSQQCTKTSSPGTHLAWKPIIQLDLLQLLQCSHKLLTITNGHGLMYALPIPTLHRESSIK